MTGEGYTRARGWGRGDEGETGMGGSGTAGRGVVRSTGAAAPPA